MPEAEALRLLSGRTNSETMPSAELEAAKGLAEDLGYLPLALVQVRAYMEAIGRGFAAYRRLFAASHPALLRRERPSPDYPTSIAKSWQISVDAAAAACPATRPLLELLAFFAPDMLPTAVLAANPDALPERLRDELKRDEAMAELHRFSLIRANADGITVHRLVQAVTRDGLDRATLEARIETAVRLLDVAWPGAPWEHTLWPRIDELLPHMLASAAEAGRLGVEPRLTAILLNNMALYYDCRSAHARAEPLYKRAIAIGGRIVGPEHPDVAIWYNNLALLYLGTSRYAEAEPLLLQAIASGERTIGSEHPELATRLQNLGALYRDTGRYGEAEPLLERALAIREKVLGPEHRETVLSLNSLEPA
jgi:tetratricopeptide (TPR) repeat protein